MGREAHSLLSTATDAQIARRLASTDDVTVAAERLREQLGIACLAHVADLVADSGQASHLGFALLRECARAHVPEPASDAVPDPPHLEEVHEQVDDIVVPIVAASLDRGAATWGPPPGPLWPTALATLLAPGATGNRTWHRAVRAEAARWRDVPASEALGGMLATLDPSEGRHEEILTALLAARPGQAGAVQWAEHHGGSATLVDYAALRLLVTVPAIR